MAGWTAAGEHPENMTKGAEVRYAHPLGDLFGIVTEVRGGSRLVVFPSIGRRALIHTSRLCWVYEQMGD